MEVLNLKVNPIQSALYQTQLWPSTARPHFSQRSKIKSTLQSSRSRWCNVTFTFRNRNAHAPSNLLPRALAVLLKGDLQMSHSSFWGWGCTTHLSTSNVVATSSHIVSQASTPPSLPWMSHLGLKACWRKRSSTRAWPILLGFSVQTSRVTPLEDVGGCWRNSEMWETRDVVPSWFFTWIPKKPKQCFLIHQDQGSQCNCAHHVCQNLARDMVARLWWLPYKIQQM